MVENFHYDQMLCAVVEHSGGGGGGGGSAVGGGSGVKTGRRGRPRNSSQYDPATGDVVTVTPKPTAHSKHKEQRHSEGSGRRSFTQLRTPPKERASASAAAASSEFYGANDPAYWEDGVESGAEQDGEAAAMPEADDLPVEAPQGQVRSQALQSQSSSKPLILLPRSQPYHDHAYTVVDGAAAAPGDEMPDDSDISLFEDLTETSSRTDGCRLRYLTSVSCPATEPPSLNNITVKLRQGM